VDAAVEHGARVIAISTMMVHTARGPGGCVGVRKLLQERGLEDRIKIAVGGAPFRFDPELYKVVGADTWAENGILAARVITALLRGGES
jgi:methanogenic corrinoid protein MtbC1